MVKATKPVQSHTHNNLKFAVQKLINLHFFYLKHSVTEEKVVDSNFIVLTKPVEPVRT